MRVGGQATPLNLSMWVWLEQHVGRGRIRIDCRDGLASPSAMLSWESVVCGHCIIYK